MTQPKPTARRCAVYTRKSSEEGLEQDFNSLHAQREACEAFIRSQAGEGWKLVKDPYDDGGLSGGTLERPALQRMMADIRAGKIDTVVVYKVDRLTRSLADFAKIVELFDGAGVTFVAVTQQFNTTSSMGRLTLNILLSFAQFEREVTGERIRDKIAASKQKGMWMGGRLSLGYDVKDRKLVINEAEAETVKCIFERYLELKSVQLLQAELAEQGVVSKPRPLAGGEVIGGVPLCRGAIYTLLANPIYVGLTRHKDACYPGQHQAIIDQSLWDAVQLQLKQNTVDKREHRTREGVGWLTGKIFDDEGKRLTPTYAKKGSRQYRYYVSQQLITGLKIANAPKWRIPATQLEQVVVREISGLLGDQHRLTGLLQEANVAASDLPSILRVAARIHTGTAYNSRTAAAAGGSYESDNASAGKHKSEPRRAIGLASVVTRIMIASDHLKLVLNVAAIQGNTPDYAANSTKGTKPSDAATIDIALQIPMQFRRRGQEMRLVVRASNTRRTRQGHSANPQGGGYTGTLLASDAILIKAIARARSWFTQLSSGTTLSTEDIARRECCNPAYVQRLLPLAFLAPDIVEAIASGRQPVEFTIASLTRGKPLPSNWKDQQSALQMKVKDT